MDDRRRMARMGLLGEPQLRPIGRQIAQQLAVPPVDHACIGPQPLALASASRDESVAVISDVHANLPALEAVIADVHARGIGRIWCLGDIVGYGASPAACLGLVQAECELVLAGNHDLAVVGDEPLANFGVHALPGLFLAQRQLNEESDGAELRAWLATRLTEVVDAERSTGFGLEDEADVARHREALLRNKNVVAAHALPSPWDTIWDYVNRDVAAAQVVAEGLGALVLVGHTHHQFASPGIANPGSVGQPRDGDPRAAWLQVAPGPTDDDPSSPRGIQLHRTEYDIERAQEAMRAEDLPRMTIRRLATGR